MASFSTLLKKILQVARRNFFKYKTHASLWSLQPFSHCLPGVSRNLPLMQSILLEQFTAQSFTVKSLRILFANACAVGNLIELIRTFAVLLYFIIDWNFRSSLNRGKWIIEQVCTLPQAWTTKLQEANQCPNKPTDCSEGQPAYIPENIYICICRYNLEQCISYSQETHYFIYKQ